MATILKLPEFDADIGDPPGPVTDQANLAFPLSAAQERVWRADRERPGDPAYNCAFRWSLEGPLDIAVLERVFNEIVARHEILRTSFTKIGADAVQMIAPSASIRIPVDDVQSIAGTERDRRIEELCGAEAKRGFDIEKGPLVRVRVVRAGEQHHLLLLTVHLLVADGWSIRVIMNELQQLYRAFSEGHASPLPELGIQYPDYVVWQREGAGENRRREQLASWKSKLANYRRLDVAGDLGPPAEFTRDSDIVSMELPFELTDALNRLSGRQGGTMFVTVLAAFCVLLQRYTGSDDIAVGSELAGRNRTELESLVGLFINHVVFRTDVSGDPRFLDLMERARETTFGVFADQDVPFEDVVTSLAADGVACPDPFFLINFNCYRAYGGRSNFVLEPAKVQVTPIPSISQGALYRLHVFMVERESGWRLSIDYNKGYYSRAFAQQLLDDFHQLLGQVASGPERKLSEFVVSRAAAAPPEPPSEAAGEAADGDAVYTMAPSVVQERFWRLAQLDPNSPTFHMRATVRLTGALSTGALERSLQNLVDRHEILRTTFAEQDGRLVQVIAARQPFSLSIVDLSQTPDAERETRLQDALREEARRPFDLERGPLFRACLFVSRPDDAVLLITTHHIIADGWSQRVVQDELWAGYDAVANDRPARSDPLPIQFADFATWQQDWLNSPDANRHLDFWLGHLEGPLEVVDFPTDRPPALRMASKGGIESLSLPRELIQDLKTLARSESVTMFALSLASFATLISRYSDRTDMVIGSPVANRRPETEPLIGPFAGPIPFRLKLGDDPTLQDVVRNVGQVSLEALDHAELPFEALLKQLRVRSVDGRTVFFQFYFLYQVAFLQPHAVPGLNVTPMPTFSVGTPFELQLAIIERQDELRVNCEYNADLFDAGSIQALLRYYEAILRAMVANAQLRVAELAAPPVQPRARPAAKAAGEAARAYVAPRTEDEIKLADIWQTILKVPRVGIHDNFFDLGGYSLLAAELVARVKAQFGVTIDLSLLMVVPTVGQMAGRLGQSLENERPHIVAIRPTGTRAPLFCIHGGGGHLLNYRDMIEALPTDLPVYGLQALDGSDGLPGTVEDLARQYLKEIRAVQPTGPYQICGLSFGGLVAYEIARRLAQAGEQAGVVALFDTGNWAHYRNLPPAQMAEFRRVYLQDRLKKYARNIVYGRFDDLAADARQFVSSRLKGLLWKVCRSLRERLGVPIPQFVRDNVAMFADVGQKFMPEPYPGKLLLFRAIERTPEYGDDETLGWEGLARDGITVHHIPGGHLSIMTKPQVHHLVSQLTPYLAGDGR